MQNSIGDQSMSKRPSDTQPGKQKRGAIQTSRFVLGPLFCEAKTGPERIGVVKRPNGRAKRRAGETAHPPFRTVTQNQYNHQKDSRSVRPLVGSGDGA
jgi:hypothetical protein